MAAVLCIYPPVFFDVLSLPTHLLPIPGLTPVTRFPWPRGEAQASLGPSTLPWLCSGCTAPPPCARLPLSQSCPRRISPSLWHFPRLPSAQASFPLVDSSALVPRCLVTCPSCQNSGTEPVVPDTQQSQLDFAGKSEPISPAWRSETNGVSGARPAPEGPGARKRLPWLHMEASAPFIGRAPCPALPFNSPCGTSSPQGKCAFLLPCQGLESLPPHV